MAAADLQPYRLAHRQTLSLRTVQPYRQVMAQQLLELNGPTRLAADQPARPTGPGPQLQHHRPHLDGGSQALQRRRAHRGCRRAVPGQLLPPPGPVHDLSSV